MSLRKLTSHGRKSISTLVLLVDGKVGNAHDISRCVPDLLMHLGICRYRSALELVAYPILLKLTGCIWTGALETFTWGDGWVGLSIAIVLNLPILFSYAQTFTLFGARQKPPHGLRASNKPELLGTTFERIGTALNHTVALVRGEERLRRNSMSFVPHHLVPRGRQRSWAVITEE